VGPGAGSGKDDIVGALPTFLRNTDLIVEKQESRDIHFKVWERTPKTCQTLLMTIIRHHATLSSVTYVYRD